MREELAQVRAKAEAEREAHAEQRKQAAAEAHRTAERLTATQAERDEARREAAQAREDAANLRGQAEALQTQQAQLMQALAARQGAGAAPEDAAKPKGRK